MGTVFCGGQYDWPEEYKVYNKDKNQFIIFTKTMRSQFYRHAARVSYQVKSVIPKTKLQTEHLIELNKLSVLSTHEIYRIVLVGQTEEQKVRHRVCIEIDRVFTNVDEATNFYVETKAKMWRD